MRVVEAFRENGKTRHRTVLNLGRKDLRVVDIDLSDGTSKRSVTRGTQRAIPVLRALGIADLDPPASPRPGQTVM